MERVWLVQQDSRFALEGRYAGPYRWMAACGGLARNRYLAGDSDLYRGITDHPTLHQSQGRIPHSLPLPEEGVFAPLLP